MTAQLLSQQAALTMLAQQQALAGLASPGSAQQPNINLIAAQIAQLQAAQLSQLGGWPMQGAGLNPTSPDISALYASQLGGLMGGGINPALGLLSGLQASQGVSSLIIIDNYPISRSFSYLVQKFVCEYLE